MKIVYYPLGGRSVASSRLRVWSIADELKKKGHEICFPDKGNRPPRDCDLIVVQKNLPNKMQTWRARFAPVVFDVDDLEGWLPECDQLTVGSLSIQEKHGGSYIPDALDVSGDIRKLDHEENLEKVCWFGSSDNLYHASNLKDACGDLGIQLVVVTNVSGRKDCPQWPNVDYRNWSLETIDQDIIDCDLVACPYRYSVNGKRPDSWVNSKSENRILKAWGLGMPVAGTAIPSYVGHKLNFAAESTEEWVEVIDSLRSKKIREEDATKGKVVAEKHRASLVADRWMDVFEEVVKRCSSA